MENKRRIRQRLSDNNRELEELSGDQNRAEKFRQKCKLRLFLTNILIVILLQYSFAVTPN